MVSVLNSSTVVTDVEVASLCDLANTWMTAHLAPSFDRNPWRVVATPGDYVHGVIVDDDKAVPGALAYHDLGKDGHPIMVVLAKTVLDHGATLTGPNGVLSALLHELGETFYDPYCNAIARGPDGKYRWREICDATQNMDYDLGGGAYAPNFCLSHWFNPNSPDANLDFLHGLTAPFQVNPNGGYQVVSSCDQGTQVTKADGSPADLPAGRGWRTLKITGVPPEGI